MCLQASRYTGVFTPALQKSAGWQIRLFSFLFALFGNEQNDFVLLGTLVLKEGVIVRLNVL